MNQFCAPTFFSQNYLLFLFLLDNTKKSKFSVNLLQFEIGAFKISRDVLLQRNMNCGVPGT